MEKLSDVDISKIAEIIKACDTLSKGLTDDEIKELAGISQIEIYNEEELVLVEDSTNRDLLVIGDGSVSVEMNLLPGDDKTVNIKIIHKNSIVGEFAFIDGSRRSANVKAVMRTEALRFPFEALDSLCKTNNQLGYSLMKNLAVLMSERLRNANFQLRLHV